MRYDLTSAVIGAGFIGPVHVEALGRLGVRVKGILGVSEEESRSGAEAMGLETAYTGLDELLADEEVDVVHVAAPNRLHFAMARDALNAGKHVMCEKPLAMNSEETSRLVELAEEKGLAGAVNYNIRFYPLCLEATAMMRDGRLGEVYSVCGSYVQDWLFYETDYNWRVLKKEGGDLRAVADIGTHWLDLIHAITGLEVESLCADLHTVFDIRRRPTGEVETFKGKVDKMAVETEPVEIDTEDYGGIMLRFSGGARGVLWVSQVTAGRKNCLRYEIAGSERALSWESESPNELWIGHRDEANEVLLRDPALLSEPAAPFANFPGGHNEGFPDTFKQSFRAFYDHIAGREQTGAMPFATFEDGHREVVLCEAILKSHREGGWVDVEGGAE